MDDAIESALDTHTGVALKSVRRVEVLSGMAGRGRVWTLEQKLALVAEMERCDNVAAFAREGEISSALLYAWRREIRCAVEAARFHPAKCPCWCTWFGETSPLLQNAWVSDRVMLITAAVLGDATAPDTLGISLHDLGHARAAMMTGGITEGLRIGGERLRVASLGVTNE